MNDIDFEKNPWRDLASLLWERVPVDFLASAIEKHRLWIRDRFGRIVEATDGGESGNDPKEQALRLLAKHYALQQEERSNIDPNALIEFPDTPLANYGWPEDALPPEISAQILRQSGSKVRTAEDGENDPHTAMTNARPTGTHLKGVRGEQIREHFDFFWGAARWKNLTSSTPVWLEPARIVKPPRRSREARWDPAQVAFRVYLYQLEHRESRKLSIRNHARAVPSRAKLEKIIRTHFPDWSDELEELFSLAAVDLSTAS